MDRKEIGRGITNSDLGGMVAIRNARYMFQSILIKGNTLAYFYLI